MKSLPRINEIIKIEPFKISCRWNTAEVRVIDFEPEFAKWQSDKNNILLPLMELDLFENVVVKDGTLQWPSIQIDFTGIDGKTRSNALDLDPDVLYRDSKPLSFYKLVMAVPKHKKDKVTA